MTYNRKIMRLELSAEKALNGGFYYAELLLPAADYEIKDAIVMKTGTHPFISKLKLFFKWGISFPENSYTIADKGARCVHYISRETLIKNITARYPQEKKPRVPASNLPSGGQSMTEPAEATFAQEVDHAAQQEKIAKPIRTG